MSNSNKNLGRGLSAFLNLESTPLDEISSKNDNQENNSESEKAKIINVNIKNIIPNPYQPRHDFNEEALQSLAESIKSKGILQPLLVIKNENAIEDNQYQLIAGERRFKASKIAGLSEVPVIVIEANKKEQLEIAILENIQREDLNPIEEAEAYKRLMNEFSHTQEELSGILGKSRSHIANILRLLTLPDDVKELLRNKQLTFGHARALIGAENASELAHHIVEQSMNVRTTESMIKNLKNIKERINQNGESVTAQKINYIKSENNSNYKNNYVDPEIINISNQISSMIGLPVNIKLKNKGGVIEIGFNSFNELDLLLSKISN